MKQGIPGLRDTEHIGFTVPDLDQAERFFVDVIGCELIYPLGPFQHDESDWMATHLNVHPRTVMRQLKFFRCKRGPNFEVFQFESHDPLPHNLGTAISAATTLRSTSTTSTKRSPTFATRP